MPRSRLSFQLVVAPCKQVSLKTPPGHPGRLPRGVLGKCQWVQGCPSLLQYWSVLPPRVFSQPPGGEMSGWHHWENKGLSNLDPHCTLSPALMGHQGCSDLRSLSLPKFLTLNGKGRGLCPSGQQLRCGCTQDRVVPPPTARA